MGELAAPARVYVRASASFRFVSGACEDSLSLSVSLLQVPFLSLRGGRSQDSKGSRWEKRKALQAKQSEIAVCKTKNKKGENRRGRSKGMSLIARLEGDFFPF